MYVVLCVYFYIFLDSGNIRPQLAQNDNLQLCVSIILLIYTVMLHGMKWFYNFFPCIDNEFIAFLHLPATKIQNEIIRWRDHEPREKRAIWAGRWAAIRHQPVGGSGQVCFHGKLGIQGPLAVAVRQLSLLRPVPIHDPSCSARRQRHRRPAGPKGMEHAAVASSWKKNQAEFQNWTACTYVAPHKLKCSCFTSSRFVPKFNQRLAKRLWRGQGWQSFFFWKWNSDFLRGSMFSFGA